MPPTGGSASSRIKPTKRPFTFPWENFVSSVCATIASGWGKLAFDFNESSFVSQSVTHACSQPFLKAADEYCSKGLSLVLRLCFFGLTVLTNSFMLKYYVDAMRKWSALQATVLNFALNFCFSAAFASWAFGEKVDGKWFVGAFVIVVGIILISSDPPVDPKKQTSKVQRQKET